MKTLTSYRKRLAGFSLVELAIVLLISGILMSAGLSLLTVKRSAAQLDTTQKHQEAIKQALISYLGKNRRLPCPSTTTGGTDDRGGASPAPCKQYSGIVPYAELGLDRAAALDGWENFITYVVSQNLNATPLTQPLAPAPVLTSAWLYSYNSATASNASPYTMTTRTNPSNPWSSTVPNPPSPWSIQTDSAFWPSTSTGGITVVPTTNQSPTPIADPTKATGAAVVLISYGKNGYGAYNVKGGQNTSATAGADEAQNINPTSSVVPTAVKRDATDSTAGGGAFDDVVMILSANDLTGPLIANGTLQSSAQAALSQANDIVMGAIVASKYSCPNNPPSFMQPVCGNNSVSNFYYTIPQTYIFPATVAAWGVIYTPSASYIDLTLVKPSIATNAYTLTAGDGTPRSVSIAELRGILNRSGFN